MRKTGKQNISGTVSVICAVVMVVCIARMIPYGMAGEVSKVKPYFALMIVALIVGLPCSVAYYYYRGNDTEDKELERMRIEADMLGSVGQRTATQKAEKTAAKISPKIAAPDRSASDPSQLNDKKNAR